MNDFQDWIGKSFRREDVITARLVDHFQKTFEPHFDQSQEVPPCFFWCLAPDSLPANQLGADGHPQLGIYLPDIPYKGRMWAGGEIQFLANFHLGDLVKKTSTIKDIVFKSGRSGKLCFVSVEHLYQVEQKNIIEEIQNIVYREDTTNRASSEPDEISNLEDSQKWTVNADSTMLFRYSAITFNGHKIHYDLPFSQKSEGHEGLLTHGPMQATLIANRAFASGLPIKSMKYRGLSPLVCQDPFDVEVGKDQERIIGRVISSKNKITMQAEFAI